MKKTIYLLISMLFIFLFSCNNSTTENTELTDNTYNIDSLNKLHENIEDVFYSLPSPMEMASILKRTGVEFDPTILHETNKISNYISTQSMAFNLGIYGADLSYASLFNENQHILLYFVNIKKLAESLNIIDAIDDSTLNQIELNISDNSVLSGIITESFLKSDAYLKENSKIHTATFIILGAWIESLYIAIELTDEDLGKEDLLHRIIDQRLILDNILSLIKNLNNEQINTVSTDFYELQEVFGELITIEYKEIYDEYADTLRTKTIINYNITQDNFSNLHNKVNTIRNKYINSN